MEKTQVTLSVFHDGQFFTALFERSDAHGYSAARVLFAAKPSDNEILSLVLKSGGMLRFSDPVAEDAEKPLAVKPKKRQREAAKAARVIGFSTKAQAALKAQHEQKKVISRAANRELKKDDEKFALRQQKRKQRHRGR